MNKQITKFNQTEAIEVFGADKNWADKQRIKYSKYKFKQACDIFDDYKRIKKKLDKILFTNRDNLKKKMGLSLYIENKMEECEKKIKRFKRLAYPIKHKFNGNEFDIPTIKEVEIKRVLEYYGIEIAQDKILCPFHQDAHPSCHIYSQSNTFYCFSCSASGDVISLVEKLENTNFITACKILNKMI